MVSEEWREKVRLSRTSSLACSRQHFNCVFHLERENPVFKSTRVRVDKAREIQKGFYIFFPPRQTITLPAFLQKALPHLQYSGKKMTRNLGVWKRFKVVSTATLPRLSGRVSNRETPLGQSGDPEKARGPGCRLAVTITISESL